MRWLAEGVKVPKPKGTGGRDSSRHEHLGLDTGEEDNKQMYKEILRSVRDWSSQILNTYEPIREQDNRKECPELNHFECIWPIKALIQQFLKNSSELKRPSARWREERLSPLQCEEPQALSVSNTSKSAAPVSSTSAILHLISEQRDVLTQGFNNGCQEARCKFLFAHAFQKVLTSSSYRLPRRPV
ncbi:hypothetical protein JB92DRAFT_2834600 [Gautieria morchelliformis]|nr:hypothetical protein JB92DRAFT_2834600 [Gautieria morchelliformis]